MPSVPSGREWATDPAHRQVMKAFLILRDGPWCHYCGQRFSTRGRRASFDHIWPQAFGIINDEWNLVLACRSCNSARGTDLDRCGCDFCQAAILRVRSMIFGRVA